MLLQYENQMAELLVCPVCLAAVGEMLLFRQMSFIQIFVRYLGPLLWFRLKYLNNCG